MDPRDFWENTVAENLACIRRLEYRDRLAWNQTANLMAQQYNMNRRKDSAALTWEEFTPYTIPDQAPPVRQIGERETNLARQMAAAMNSKK